MVRSVKGVHEASESERRTLREQSLPQVLRSFQVLQILHEKLCSCEVLHHSFHLGLLIIANDDDLVDLEDCRSLGYLPD